MMTREHRREFALLRLLGASRGHIVRMLAAESVLVAIAGATIGTAVATATIVPFDTALGSDASPGGLGTNGGVLAGVAGLTVLATAVPAVSL